MLTLLVLAPRTVVRTWSSCGRETAIDSASMLCHGWNTAQPSAPGGGSPASLRRAAQRGSAAVVCWPIVPGDTVSRLARHLTGDPRSGLLPGFQIRDPVRQMFVPKSQYRSTSQHALAQVLRAYRSRTFVSRTHPLSRRQ